MRTYHVWRAQHAQPIIVRNCDRMRPALQTAIENVLLASMAQVYPEDRGTNYAVSNGLEAAQEVERRIHRSELN